MLSAPFMSRVDAASVGGPSSHAIQNNCFESIYWRVVGAPLAVEKWTLRSTGNSLKFLRWVAWFKVVVRQFEALECKSGRYGAANQGPIPAALRPLPMVFGYYGLWTLA